MSITRTTLLALATAIGVGGSPLAHAETPIRDVTAPGGITITGTVGDVFGNKFVLQDDSGKVLVESGPEWHRRIAVQPGEKVTVSGRPGPGGFEAFAITRADGTRIEVRPAGGPPPWGGARADRGPGPGPGPDGRGPRHVAPPDEKSRAELTEILGRAGYRDITDFDRKRHHFEVEARNRYGEKVEVHIDFAGNIYKEKRDD
ncbi:MAG: PepSY domain-containing protein [Alphaproteobacteria bacterium]|nr:PepSY domain-containing protein [Alphaproteobacteria bacterium]